MEAISNFLSEINQILMDSNQVVFFIITLLLVVLIILILCLGKSGRKMKKKQEQFHSEPVIKAPETLTNSEIKEIKEIKAAPVQDTVIAAMASRLEAGLEEVKPPTAVFEKEQEENSIISYQELLANAAMKTKEKPQKKESTVVEEVPVIPVKNKVEDHNGFKIAPFISPVFGIERPDLEIRQLDKEETIENPKLKPEKTIDVSSLNQQTKESDDFLKSLKDLRKNLD